MTTDSNAFPYGVINVGKLLSKSVRGSSASSPQRATSETHDEEEGRLDNNKREAK